MPFAPFFASQQQPEWLGSPTVDSDRRALPLYLNTVAAGFPSPAQDYLEGCLDLHELLIKHPTATFFVRARGDSMRGAAIFDGDILLVDRALQAQHQDIVIASVDGDMTVKRLLLQPQLTLQAANPKYPPMVIADGTDFEVFGVVSSIIHQLKR
ncbi:translesion error-prone DNA polymerase V autoproteolytic subunit [Alkalimonas collagenimarina]|uniref:Translesion error-prone DNA polymerase V autoproteolytic subunit n=1 Tax=Alkalimonas collagenimarina TaxID=400390 RepID=A0ABT9GWM4_9GAMM|nr:translesion error-prone DNA polymerase V autoproteolytic subunit [Alkalimonas collagenimarina]MDP4535437.1 translesion error-prone DNA polymerase V autoproteolytic subunit [Alkalimonas collagenimarina]